MSFIVDEIAPGLKIAYRQVSATRISHFGITFNTGSRDEKENEAGIAHLLEHMLFKGTGKRNWRDVLNSIEMVGGEMNAYTTREKTCVYASVISDHTRLAIDLLADISLHSTFPENELEKEKKVILDEMDMYADNPEEMILDEFYERLYPGHPIGTNILGYKDKFIHYNRRDIIQFAARLHYHDQMVVSYTGPLSLKQVKEWCVQYFGSPGLSKKALSRKAPGPSVPFNLEKTTAHHQCHAVYGNRTVDMFDKRRTALMLLANILGGTALNSVLNMSLREKNGLTYGVEASYNYYTDTGLFYIQWTADPKNLRRTIRIVKRELEKFANKPLSTRQLHLYKTQFKGQMIMSEESNQGLMLMMGRSYLDFREIEPLEKVLAEIDAVTADELQQLAGDIFDPGRMSMLLYIPG